MNTRKDYSSKQKQWFRFIPSALFLAGCLFVVVSCGKEDTPSPNGSDKVVVMFGVDAGEGSLAVKVEGREIQSPAEVEKGKTVVFSAIHSKAWQVRYWKVNGVMIRSVKPEQEFIADKHLDIRVAFRPYSELLSEHE